VSGQLTDNGPEFGANVFEPRDADIDRGAHGMFDDSAHPHDPWSAISMGLWRAKDTAVTSARSLLRR
jgi:hypothetical protein